MSTHRTVRLTTGYVAVTFLAVVLAACGTDDGVEPILELPRPLTSQEQAVVGASNTFGLDLFRRVHAGETHPNVFLSPVSASMALGMTMNGTASETWTGMREALRFGTLSQSEINESYRGLVDLLLDLDPRVEIGVGNSIWTRLGFPVKQSFYDVVKEYFDAEAREMDFTDPATKDTINAWIQDATKGLIEKGIDEISEADKVFLINAIVFDGRWTAEFDEEDTRPATFTRSDESTVQVQMMHMDADLPYARTDRYTAVELGYGGGAFAMLVVLPRYDVGLADLVASLDDAAWADLVAALDTAEVELGLPKFTIEYDAYLNDPLVAMGMDSAFSPAADFSGLTPVDSVCIQYVRQKSYVEVDEAGTKAAAVTVVSVGLTSAGPMLYADRPFLFAIRERHSGTILFLGTIGDPTAEDAPEVEKPRPPC